MGTIEGLLWFTDCEKIPDAETIGEFLARHQDQRVWLRMCIDLARVAGTLAKTKAFVSDGISESTILVKSGAPLVCGVSSTKKANPKDTSGYLESLAKIANLVAKKVESDYMVSALGNATSFEKFGDVALDLFKAYPSG